MRVRIVLIFVGSILIPTALLSYFGFVAVNNEKRIVEKIVTDRSETAADIVAGEIDSALKKKPAGLGTQTALESLIQKQTELFKGSVAIFDENGRVLDPSSGKKISDAVFLRPLKGLPYTLAVYENIPPVLLRKFQEKKRMLYGYAFIICFSAFLIIAGGSFTLWSLSREWRKAGLKSEFVTHLSHDLRRPLTSIRMFSEMLQSGRVTSQEKRQEYYDIIASESERLTYFANNILDFSRVEAKRKKFDFKSGDLNAVVADSVERFNRHLLEGSNRAEFSATDPIPLMVRMDANALSQVIINLLSNAAKYSSPNSGIRINLARRKNQAVVEVIDRGIGIPKKELKKIFESYYRVPRKEVTDTEGTGLGLALVSYIVAAHQGRIMVESQEAVGSTFSISLPLFLSSERAVK